MPKRRKKSRPAREPGHPLTKDQCSELILPAYVAIDMLMKVPDEQAAANAFDSLAAFIDYMRVSASRRPTMREELATELEPAARALFAIQVRYRKTKICRGNAEQIQSIRRAVTWADQNLHRFNTQDIARACVSVFTALYGEAA